MGAESVLRRMRVEKNVPMRVVADHVRLTLAGYQAVEVGNSGVSAEKATAIANYFGVPVSAIFVPTNYKVISV